MLDKSVGRVKLRNYLTGEKLNTTVVGNYPKISSDKKAPNLRNSIHAWEQKKINSEQLEQVYQETIKRVLNEQAEAGIDIITDGQIRWDDLVTPLARSINGFEIGGLLRFFNNNVYYRRPVVKSKLFFKNYLTVDQFKFAQSHSPRPVKVALPGPFTLAQLSLDEYYHNLEKLVLDLADLLYQEIAELERAGCQFIQLDEPSLCYHPGQVELAVRAIDRIFSGVKAKKIVFFYFGRIDGLLPRVLDSSAIDAVGTDIVSHQENLDRLLNANWNGKELILGSFDARNTKLEREEDILKMVDRVSKRIPLPQVTLSSSCGLEFLPHQSALKKLHTLSAIARRIN